MKRIFIYGVLILLFGGCASSIPATKSWHVSPDYNPMSSDIYGFSEWSDIKKLYIGMSTDEAENIVGILQSYHHPSNAIVFTKYKGKRYEVGLKLSKDKQKITDISYKVVAD